EWVHVQLHQQKGMISLSPPTICNSAFSGPFIKLSLAIPITLFFLLPKPLAINSKFSVSNKEPLYFGHVIFRLLRVTHSTKT
ncbi:hypothetical protein NP287_21610, partial [Salmonella enterica]|nr:hypothetical protein [Salmonella enterica]MCQ7948305.1 hypothetical protein [Salmonella enterica]MCQ7970352.1 hypothetical protein [Salmonella enterica]